MSRTIFPHQCSAYHHLLDTGHGYFSVKWHRLPIQPRFHRLIIGPTGVGKSHLVKTLAKELEAAYFKVNLMSYLPCGCSQSQGKQTAKELLDVLLENDRTVLFIDELDKIDHDTSWTAYIKAEVYGLLDGLWPAGLDFAHDSPEEDGPHYRRARAKHRLKYKCYIVGAGTWQSVWNDGAKRTIGYHPSPAAHSPSLAKLVSSIPLELINRFSFPPILISSLTMVDYEELIHASAKSLPEDMADQFFAIGMSGIKNALEHGKGCRYVEEVLTQVFIDEDAEERSDALLMETSYLPLRCKIVRIGEPTLPEFGVSRHPVDTPIKCVEFWDSIIVPSDDYHEDKEHLVVVCLNARLKPTGYHLVALGGLNECVASPREIFRAAIAAAAYGFLLIHNHPSGDPTPSEPDRRLTNRLKDAADMLAIKFIDHVVVGQAATKQPSYFSFKENGVL